MSHFVSRGHLFSQEQDDLRKNGLSCISHSLETASSNCKVNVASCIMPDSDRIFILCAFAIFMVLEMAVPTMSLKCYGCNDLGNCNITVNCPRGATHCTKVYAGK